MKYSVSLALPLLSATPKTLRALLAALPAEWLEAREAPGTWTPVEILGHLIHGEMTDWITRARVILVHGTGRAFDPFDMTGHQQVIAGKTVGELLDEFERLRSASVEALAAMALTEEDLAREGLHPAFGRVTLGQHLATWVAHDLDHICQIARLMAKQFKEEVGPWAAYLGVLHDREPRG
jgi:hypothetical protein